MVTTVQQPLHFARFTLDLERCALRRGGDDLPLRPKSFDVLRYLAEHAGRVISKNELIEGVWPGIHVTDDSLVQCIGDIRQVLGAEGHTIIKTIPRRGYLFAVEVSHAAENAPAVSAPGAVASAGASESHDAMAGRRTTILVIAALIVMAAVGMLTFRERLQALSHGAIFRIDKAGSTNPFVAHSKPSIAVLPLLNLSGDAQQDYFSDGVTEDIIIALSKFSSLTVMSRNAVFAYKGRTAPPEEIGRNLKARYLVEGSAVRIGQRVRVSMQLIDTERSSVLWAGRFDEELQDLFALRDKITAQIVLTLAIKVTEIERKRSMAKPTASLEAYDYVLRARQALRHPVRATNVEARALFGRAIELDPNYAAAYVALGETLVSAISMGWMESPIRALERVEGLALKALELNSAEVRAHVLLARIHVYFRRYERALGELRQAVAVNPNDAEVLAGRGNILLWLGQTGAAIDLLEAARNVNPDLSHLDRFALGLGYYLQGRYGAAAELLERNLSKSPTDSHNHVLLALIYVQQDRRDDAARALASVRRLLPLFNPDTFGSQLRNPEDRERVRDGLRKLERLSL